MKDFSEMLIWAREAKGMNRRQFAEAIGVSSNAVRKWEDGEVFPLPDKWAAIKEVVGLDPQAVKSGSNSVMITKSKDNSVSQGNVTVGRLDVELTPAQKKFFLTTKNLFTTDKEWEDLLLLALGHYASKK